MSFDPNKTNVSPEKQRAWIASTCQGDPNEVPGVGERTVEAFADNGITSTYQLLGWALMQQDGKRSQAQIADKVFDFVKSEKDGARANAHTITQSLMSKASMGMQNVPCVPNPKSSRANEQKQKAWLAKNIDGANSTIDQDDLTGIGDQAMAAFNKAGIKTYHQLVGKMMYMEAGDGGAFDEEKAATFIKNHGVAPAFAKSVVFQLFSKLTSNGFRLGGKAATNLFPATPAPQNNLTQRRSRADPDPQPMRVPAPAQTAKTADGGSGMMLPLIAVAVLAYVYLFVL